MAGYIGSKSSVTQVDGYNRTEADTEFVNDPNSVITVSSGNVGIGTSSPSTPLHVVGAGDLIRAGADSQQISIGVNTGGGENYIYGSNHPIKFGINGTERMRIDSSGNVGIGTSSPSQKLHVEGAGNQFILLNNSTTNDGFYFKAGAGASSIQTNAGSHVMNFFTGGSERMRITSSGELVNTGSTLPSASVQGFGVQDQTIYTSATSTSTRNHHIFYNGNGAVGSIKTSGSSTSYNTSSDYRLKTDAQPMTGASARVQALSPVNFEWIADGTRVDGFLAHEAQAVVPEAVTGTKDAMRDEEYEVTPAVYEDVVIPAVLDEDGNELEAERTEQQLVTEAVMGTRSVPDYQGIDQSKLVPLLTAALQEALTEISDLKARVTALEAV